MERNDANSQPKGSQECKMFIGGLHLDTTLESLKDHFKEFGEITDAVVMKDPHTRRSRGFGFVTFDDSKAVEACLEGRPHVIDGREVEVKRAIPREESAPAPRTHTPARTKKVFLGGLTLDTAEEDIREVLEQFGTLTSVQIMTEKISNKPRGFGFALFEDFESVDRCCEKKYIEIKGRDVEIKKAVPQEDMRRHPEPYRGGGGGRYPRGGDSYGRDPYAGGYARSMGGYGMGGYDYSRYQQADYSRYPGAESYVGGAGGYGAAVYSDRTAATTYAAYPGYRGGYDMAAYSGMYGGAAAAAMGGYQQQATSNYGPARVYGELNKDRAGKTAQFHPYRR